MRNVYITFTATKYFDESSYYLKRVVREAVKATLEYEDFPYDAEVSVTFCDNEYIKELNKEYRGIDRHTDVLSFPMYDFAAGDEPCVIPGECVTLGDIVISIERAEVQAKELGNTWLSPNLAKNDTQSIQLAVDNGIGLSFWTVNTIEDAKMLYDMGVRYMETDKLCY